MTTRAGGRPRSRRAPAAGADPAPPASGSKETREASAAVRTARRRRLGELAAEHWRALTAVALLILGGVLVLLGWYGTAYTNIFTEQIPYLISGGLLGLGLMIVAGFLAVSAMQSREIRELRADLTRALEALAGSGTHASSGGNGSARSDGRVFVLAGGRSFHVPGCPILEGKDSEGLAPSRAADAGFVACKLCGPD